MKAVILKAFGGVDQMYIGDAPMPVPPANYILVKVVATAANRADTLQRAGKYPPPAGESTIMGLEFSGTVVGLGPEISRWQEGDSVCGLLAGGGYAEYIIIHQDLALPIPEGLSFQEAAAIPEVFLTAFQAIVWLAKLQKEDTILIHAGASGVGTAAIQLARNIGAKVLVTASAGKHALCQELGADHCIDYKKEDFAQRVAELTNKKGANVVIDFVGATYFSKNLEVLAPDGRMVMLAFLGGIFPEKVNLAPILRKRLSIMGSTLRARSLDYKIKLSQELAHFAWNDFSTGQLVPVIDSVFPLEEVAKAHTKMEANLNQGKIILNLEN